MITVQPSTTSRNSVSSNVSAMKETHTSRIDNARLSVYGDHPAYSFNSKEANETTEKEAVSYISKRTVILLICSENGCVSLTEIDVRIISSNFNLSCCIK